MIILIIAKVSKAISNESILSFCLRPYLIRQNPIKSNQIIAEYFLNPRETSDLPISMEKAENSITVYVR
jgi:hypothetical protein